MSIIKSHTKTLTSEEIDKLYPLVNDPREWRINVNSHELIDKLIELWFNTQGYDFWENPYPEVTEMSYTPGEKEITFTYITD